MTDALHEIYPNVAHPCWLVHKFSNLLGGARRQDHVAMKADSSYSLLCERAERGADYLSFFNRFNLEWT
ncbi:MAG: hypothetical protein JSS39_06290 [Nitrospira sp.]|nr:hypothetical protein [Nitrospira sp.]